MKLRFFGVFLCAGLSAFSQKFEVVNALDCNRTDELIVLQRSAIEKAFPEALAYSTLSVKKPDGAFAVLQLDDLNYDGVWDEAVFLADLAPKSSTFFTLADLKVNGVLLYPRAHVRLRKKSGKNTFGKPLAYEVMPEGNPPTDFLKTPLPLYLTEGPAWENDKVAFRSYFDTRNGKDIFGKLTSKMMMDTVGTKTAGNYHKIANWGMDILHAGNSLGAGALAFGIKINGKDSIVRLGGNEISKQTYTRISDGPYRAVFRLDYDWMFFGKPVKVSEEIHIWGGQYFYESRISTSGFPKGTVLYSGMADFYDNRPDRFWADGKIMLCTQGDQSELRDDLTLGIALDNRRSVTPMAAPREPKSSGYQLQIFDTYLVGQQIPDQKASFRFYAFWGQRLTADRARLEQEVKKYDSKPEVRWQP